MTQMILNIIKSFKKKETVKMASLKPRIIKILLTFLSLIDLYTTMNPFETHPQNENLWSKCIQITNVKATSTY